MYSLAAGTVLDVPSDEQIAVAARAGYDGVGLRLDPGTSPAEARRLHGRARDLGLRVLDLEVARLDPAAPFDDALRLLDLARAVEADFLLTISRHEAHADTVDAVRRLQHAAAGSGVRVALEFMPFTTVRTLADAVRVLDDAGPGDAVVLVDTLHLQRGGQTADALGPVADRVGYLQVCDARGTPPADSDGLLWEAKHDRLPPGEGVLPLAAVRRHLPDVPVSVEVQSLELEKAHDPLTRATLLLERTKAALAG